MGQISTNIHTFWSRTWTSLARQIPARTLTASFSIFLGSGNYARYFEQRPRAIWSPAAQSDIICARVAICLPELDAYFDIFGNTTCAVHHPWQVISTSQSAHENEPVVIAVVTVWRDIYPLCEFFYTCYLDVYGHSQVGNFL